MTDPIEFDSSPLRLWPSKKGFWFPTEHRLETGQGVKPCEVTGMITRECQHCCEPDGMWCHTCKRGLWCEFGRHVCVTYVLWVRPDGTIVYPNEEA